jgi:hypothetical protein
MIETHMGEGQGVTAGHGSASGGGWGANGAQVIPRLQLVNAAPAVSYGCRLSLPFIFVFIFFFIFFFRFSSSLLQS